MTFHQLAFHPSWRGMTQIHWKAEYFDKRKIHEFCILKRFWWGVGNKCWKKEWLLTMSWNICIVTCPWKKAIQNDWSFWGTKYIYAKLDATFFLWLISTTWQKSPRSCKWTINCPFGFSLECVEMHTHGLECKMLSASIWLTYKCLHRHFYCY